jgi:hypothetical protein
VASGRRICMHIGRMVWSAPTRLNDHESRPPQAWRDAWGDTDAPDDQDDGGDDPWSQYPEVENHKILAEKNGRFPA